MGTSTNEEKTYGWNLYFGSINMRARESEWLGDVHVVSKQPCYRKGSCENEFGKH